MKIDNIANVIDNFIKSSMHTILITGDWGIGKTYAIQEYIRNKQNDIKNKKIKIAYSSLFGKNSIDEINTELYMLFNPQVKILNVVSNVAKLINFGVNFSCGINLNLDTSNINSSNKVKKKRKYINNLIILDDLERKSDQYSSEELLGFINSLVNQGLKVLVLANLKFKKEFSTNEYEVTKIKEEKSCEKYSLKKIHTENDLLTNYKEKVFDRIYHITETHNEIIKSIFKDNYKFLDEKLIDEFNNNLRMAIKTFSLFQQIKDYIEEKHYENINFYNVMKICIYSIIELMENKYSKIFDSIITDNNYMKYMEKSFNNFVVNYDDSLKNEVPLIFAINNIYLNEDYSKLDELFSSSNKDNLFDSCFYYSDRNKVSLIKKQYEYILKLDKKSNFSTSSINQFIRDWYCYANFVDLSFINEEDLFKKLHSLDFYIDSFGEENEHFIKMIDKYNLYCEKQIKFEIENLLKDQNISVKKKGFYELSKKYINFNDEDKKHIENFLIKNNFMFQHLSGDIDYEKWDLDHIICNVISNNVTKLKNDLLKVLNNEIIKNNKDLSCKYRVNSLIKQYNLKNNE